MRAKGDFPFLKPISIRPEILFTLNVTCYKCNETSTLISQVIKFDVLLKLKSFLPEFYDYMACILSHCKSVQY